MRILFNNSIESAMEGCLKSTLDETHALVQGNKEWLDWLPKTGPLRPAEIVM
jgi:hypothetical protein